MKLLFSILLFFVFVSELYAAVPIANYQMDECSWNGTAGEVKDSSVDGVDNSGTITEQVSIDKEGVIYSTALLNGGVIDINNLNVSTVAGAKTTVAFWMYWDGTNSVMPFGWNRHDLWLTGGHFGFNSSNGDLYGIDSSALANGWHHVTAVFTNGDYTQNKLYIDKVEQTLTQRLSSQTNTYSVVSTSARIGGWRYGSGYNFKSKIDELKIWNGELSFTEVQNIYDNELMDKNYDGSSRNATCISPLAEYRLDECTWSGLENEIIDSSGNGYGGKTVNALSNTQSGKIDKAGNFSANKYITLDNRFADISIDTFSISLWVKPTMAHEIDSNSSSGTAGTSGQHYAMYPDINGTKYGSDYAASGISVGTNGISVYENNNSGYMPAVLVWTGTVSSTLWTQVTVVYKDSIPSLYVNGAWVKTGQKGSKLHRIPTNIIGSKQDGDFTGLIDEVKIWNIDLNTSSISTIYANENSGKNQDGSIRQIISCDPIAEYRMDECSWVGAPGEVKDSSLDGIDNNGTIVGQVAIDKDGKLYSSGLLSGGAININNLNVSTVTGAKTTVAFWMYWDGTNSVMPFGWYSHDLWLVSGNFGFNTAGGDLYGMSSSALANGWHHVTAVFTNGDYTKNKLYIDKVEQTLTQKQGSQSKTNAVVTTSARVGGWLRDNGYRFRNKIDELKIWNGELSSATISTLYNNEMAGKNYNGTSRAVVICGLSTCYTDDFNRANLGSKWSIIKADNFTPKITDNKLVLTDDVINIAAGVSLIGEFPSSDNMIEIEFEHNAYARTNGADGVAVVLSDANITPVAGGYGGSLGYAPKNSIPGFTGAWLGFGIDEFGNFSLDNDGNKGRGCISPYKGTARVLDSLTIRGRGASNNLDGYCFIANSGALTPGVDAVTAQNHKYKFIIDTRTGTKITVQRDTNNSGYVTLPNMDEMDATQTAAAPANFKLSLTGSTGGSKNWHTFDNLAIRAANCGTLGEDKNVTNNFFDAWETSGDIASRAIQTKIVKQSFTLNVVGLNDANNAYQDFNGTLCARLIDSNDKALTGWNKLLFTGANLQTTNFTSDYASKDTRVALSWKKNVDTLCPISLEDNSTKSTDHFAIRPRTFSIAKTNSAIQAYAGETFQLDFKALNALNANSLDYNETKDSSFSITSVINKSGCSNGLFSVSSFGFEDGQKLAIDSNFSEVGDINITIAEKNGNEFAKIDSVDTSTANRFISSVTFPLTVSAYELNITDTNFTASTAKNWLYDANVSDMYVTAQATVQANNKQHVKLENFTSTCYAQPVDLKFYYDSNNTNSDVNLSYITLNGTMSSSLKTVNDINKTVSIPSSSFITASASAAYRFNIDRTHYKALTPIDIALREVKVSSIDVAKNENNATLNIPKRFYYGRVKTKDLHTDKTTAQNSLHVEVYSTTPLVGFYQNTLNWYINADDSNVTLLDNANLKPYGDFTKNNLLSAPTLLGSSSINMGKMNFTLFNATSQKGATFHLEIPTWLWYSSLSTKTYDVLGDCSAHPCFEYKFIENATSIGIKSGEFKGSSIGSDYNSSYQKSGVKTFR